MTITTSTILSLLSIIISGYVIYRNSGRSKIDKEKRELFMLENEDFNRRLKELKDKISK